MGQDLINRVLSNQFRVDSFIASGGMGAVYRVWDLKRNVPLAMKVLHSDLAEDPAMFKRFQREANALKKLTHPNIVPFYGLFKADDFDFMLERFIDGTSLAGILKKRKGPMPVADTLVYMKALCAALGYAHSFGVIHCDIKPGNVMVDGGGHIYLTDFGIARHAESTATSMGSAGTPAYMAPEQIRGEAVTPATDIYALGVMLFELLTGQRPFRGTETGTEKSGETVNERIRYGQLHLQPPDLRAFNPDLPALLSEVVIKSLNKDPKERYPSTHVFFEEICKAASTAIEALSDRTSIPEELVAKTTTTLPPPKEFHGERTGAKRPNRTVIFGGAGAVGLLIIIGLIIGLSGKGGSVKPTPTATLPKPTLTRVPTRVPPTATPTLTPTITPEPKKGDSWTRPADGMVMLYVPAGEFTMGSNDIQLSRNERPPHTVYLDGFWMDKTEVTNNMYQLCINDGRCQPPQVLDSYTHFPYFEDPLYDDYPVIHVDWFQADTYCRWAEARLPTEAEWEKAARGTDERKFPWGSSNPKETLLNYNNYLGDTNKVGSYPVGVSPYGMLDMAGNVFEWVNDWLGEDYYSNSPHDNPTGPSTGIKRVLRGGGWNMEGDRYINSAFRYSSRPEEDYMSFGFRCAR